MSEPSDDRDPPAPRPRVPTGLRPAYLGDGTGDRLLYMLLALTTEFSALREEVEDLRRFLNQDGDGLARFLAAHPRDEAEQAAARQRREALLDTMFRILREDFALEGDERMRAYLQHMGKVAGR
jgi:hypothetical protein